MTKAIDGSRIYDRYPLLESMKEGPFTGRIVSSTPVPSADSPGPEPDSGYRVTGQQVQELGLLIDQIPEATPQFASYYLAAAAAAASFKCICATASSAIGTLYGEQDT